ncbi:MAG: GntR family transcriptional regulator [Deltaproteobacteria bacterium]|nr:GntR family transcriptional regulator [Deltaproteobacteria bacterium]
MQPLKFEIDQTEVRENGHVEWPVYQKLAEIIRQRIIDGTYKSGEKIPSEVALCKSSGLALLTVRQALGVLADEGLLERFPGRGTYVSVLHLSKASFIMSGLEDRFSSEDLKVRIVCTSVKKASEDIAKRLSIKVGESVAYLKRTIGPQNEKPFMIQEGFFLLDPFRPIIEAELASTYLIDLFKGSGQGLIKTANIRVKPGLLPPEDAALLGRREGEAVFKMEYTFYDSASKSLAFGLFSILEEAMTLSSTIGVPLVTETDNNHD